MPANELTRLFGEDFAGQLANVLPGSWEGPLRSAYGVHFVRVTSQERGRPASLDEARPTLLREWNEQQRVKANAEAFARLRDRYRVVIEQAAELPREKQP
jgi:parvulin-like peptidyl-prolyl isomerase